MLSIILDIILIFKKVGLIFGLFGRNLRANNFQIIGGDGIPENTNKACPIINKLFCLYQTKFLNIYVIVFIVFLVIPPVIPGDLLYHPGLTS